MASTSELTTDAADFANMLELTEDNDLDDFPEDFALHAGLNDIVATAIQNAEGDPKSLSKA